jgi:hypothetical protein
MMKAEVSKGGHAPVFSDEGVVIKVKKKKLNHYYFHSAINVPSIYTVKVKVKFTLEQATKVQRGSRGIALLFL